MANRDGGIRMHEEKRYGLADNVAAAKDDGVGAFDFNVIAAQDFHAPRRCASHETGAPADEAAEVHGVKSVNVFGGIDRFQDALDIHLRGKRELNQDAVNVVVAVQIFDNGKYIEGAHRGWRRDEGTRESDFLAGGDFALDVELRSRIVPHEDGCEARANAGGCEQPDFVL